MNAGQVTSSVRFISPTGRDQQPTKSPVLSIRDREPTGPLVSKRDAGQPAEAELARHVETFVAGSFFGTMLKQMRESPFRSELFAGGRAGGAYDAMYHQVLAERMGRGVGQSLVRAIVKRIMGSDGGQHSRSSSGSKLNLIA